MKTEEVMFRRIYWSSNDGVVSVSRERHSGGHRAIVAKRRAGSGHQTIEFTGVEGEAEARELLKLLSEALGDPCELPNA